MELPPFTEFPKIGRWSKEVIVTEKIDGTNAQIYVSDDGTEIAAASRNRWITPESDNMGFARWVHENREGLLKLGPGRHYGEWWGRGIQCGYGLQEKRFSLFNVTRWAGGTCPSCCDVVPELWRGDMNDLDTDAIIGQLRNTGSVAAPGWMHPEGIVVFHTGTSTLFKKFLKNDYIPKGAQ